MSYANSRTHVFSGDDDCLTSQTIKGSGPKGQETSNLKDLHFLVKMAPRLGKSREGNSSQHSISKVLISEILSDVAQALRNPLIRGHNDRRRCCQEFWSAQEHEGTNAESTGLEKCETNRQFNVSPALQIEVLGWIPRLSVWQVSLEYG